MDIDTNPFPLLRLPPRAQKCVLLSMHAVYVFAFSLLSTSAMQLVKSLNFRRLDSDERIMGNKPVLATPNNFLNCELLVQIGNSINFVIKYGDLLSRFTLRFYTQNPHVLIMADQTPPGRIRVNCMGDGERMTGNWTLPDYSIKDVFDHFKLVLNQQKIRELCFVEGEQRFELNSLKEVIGDVEKLYILPVCSDEATLSIARTFHMADAIHFERRSDSMQKALIQNFEESEYFPHGDPSIQVNDLVVCNAQRFQILDFTFSDRDINRFLKLWILGSNPRLQRLEFVYTTRDRRELLRGIKTQPISMENKRRLQDFGKMARNITEMDLYRKDGTMASLVMLGADDTHCSVHLFVWHL